jgi:nicotinamidase-related amidase
MITNGSALLLLDLQNEMVSPEGKIGKAGLAKSAEERGVMANAKRLLTAFRDAGRPVFHIRLGFRADYADSLSVAPRIARLKQNGAAILGTWGAEFPDALAPADGELVVTKQCVNPFFNTNLLSLLHARKINRLVLGGVATNMVVESTARYGDDAGFEIVVVEDCCAASSPDAHDWSIKRSLPLYGSVVTTDSFLSSQKAQ